MKPANHSLIIATSALGLMFYAATMTADLDTACADQAFQGRDYERQAALHDTALTEEQTAEITEILSVYDPSSLTAEEARQIHTAFRNAGIRPGPEMRETIEACGFDPQTLRQLDPPPSHHRHPRPFMDSEGQQ